MNILNYLIITLRFVQGGTSGCRSEMNGSAYLSADPGFWMSFANSFFKIFEFSGTPLNRIVAISEPNPNTQSCKIQKLRRHRHLILP